MRNWKKILIDNTGDNIRIWYHDVDGNAMVVHQGDRSKDDEVDLIPLVDGIEFVDYRMRYIPGGNRFVYIRATYLNFIFFSHSDTGEVYCNIKNCFDFSEILYNT